nr:unnamed protein product [Callosobruchus chinensis]
MYAWNLTVSAMVYPYTVFNYDRPTMAPGGGSDIVMPLDVVVPCVENATKLCAPPLVAICTAYKEVMCLESLAETKFCERFNTTCIGSTLPCADNLQDSPWCSNKTEDEVFEKDGKKHVAIQIPCFANITVNSNLPSFEIHEFNGTLPEGQNTSYTYHYRYTHHSPSILMQT